MPKKSELQQAIDALQSEIDVLLMARDRLAATRRDKPVIPKRTRKPKPQAAEKAP